MKTSLERRLRQRNLYRIRRLKKIEQGIKIRIYVHQRHDQIYSDDMFTWPKIPPKGSRWSYWKGGD